MDSKCETFKDQESYVSNARSEFIFKRNYARWIPEKQRRETWEEAVDRFCNFLFKGYLRNKTPEDVKANIRTCLSKKLVMPSMRALWSAGAAANNNNASIYNCSALPIQSTTDFAELMFLLMSSCGVGLSVEDKHIRQLPTIPGTLGDYGSEFLAVYHVGDSKEAQADSIKYLMDALYEGKIVEFDYTSIRPAGARLVTSGGRASGAEPVKRIHTFIFDTMVNARGRKLNSLEVSDICNKIAECVEAGGARRSAQLLLTDLDDEKMKHTKYDLYCNSHRSMANISAVYEQKPTPDVFMEEMASLVKYKMGERGIFNREAARKKAGERNLSQNDIMTNPCGEIILKPYSFCNLTEVVARQGDSLKETINKAIVATWIGVLQSTFTDFTYLRPIWKENTENDRVLGVSITGIMDNYRLFVIPRHLRAIREAVSATAFKACEILEIENPPKARTCIKPSGTVSQLVDSASGIHPRFAPYYIRRYGVSAIDPLYGVLKESGVKLEPAAGMSHLPEDKITHWSVSFPVKSPDNSIPVKNFSSEQQIDLYLLFMKHYAEHNISTTIYVKDEDWLKVAAQVYEHFDEVVGITLFPETNIAYEKPPYEEITKEKYEEMVKSFPEIGYHLLAKYETEDNTTSVPSIACFGNSCEIN